jgi:hypothetical protein
MKIPRDIFLLKHKKKEKKIITVEGLDKSSEKRKQIPTRVLLVKIPRDIFVITK